MRLRPLTDEALLARLDALAAQERADSADVVEHLAEVDRRGLAIERGYGTLFEYCRRKLKYSEAATFLRIRAARAVNQYPRILDDLRSGSLHLDAVMRLSPYLKSENGDQILDQAAGASKREILALVARLDPTQTAPERDVVRPLPPRGPIAACSLPEAGGVAPTAKGSSDVTAAEIIPPPSRVRLAFTADDEFLALLERLRRLNRHQFPSGRLEDLFKKAMSYWLDRIDPDRRVSRVRPKGDSTENKSSRRIPQAIKTAVWKRDGGRCAYVAPDGRRCESVDFLEYDHVKPWALGGSSDRIENIRLLCRAHNLWLARRLFQPESR